MSGWSGARNLVAGTSHFSRFLQLESQLLTSRLGSRQIHVAAAAAAAPVWRCRRTHDRAELEFKRDQIRTQIRMLELGRRRFTTTPSQMHGHIDPPKPGEELHVTFIDKDGDRHEFEVSEGDNLLDIAQANDLEMEGACGGSCACSTCHVIVENDEMFEKMEEPSDDENDMLDLAFGLTETSRLGCQVLMSKELDGLVVKLPKMTRNMQASDFEKS
ncbi:uncharacterized protein A1O9_09357 [Exophiala aquamarina CBS 119918]|uniref:2Fe-2S ferredoxin-type domain-containing protein n=1 Tax=Exophiala aquamarina CBS 119918 TaxID=1182545 RepID=A0A072P495_9EURO|nr:uncharacterized protein A1O9_09357 [Exophiala aquamarina CBS 119918]KEF54914.1 hypothetical protein A1O9_09357 [Exophiala aquamarina CBS 119918]